MADLPKVEYMADPHRLEPPPAHGVQAELLDEPATSEDQEILTGTNDEDPV